MSPSEKKDWLAKKLGREVTFSRVTINSVQCYLVDYIRHDAPATKLAGASEDDAIDNLFTYLQSAPELPPEPGT